MSLRPPLLDPLFAPATALPGVGPKLAPALDRLVGRGGQPARVIDVAFHVPSGSVSRTLQGSIADAPVGQPVTIAGTVTGHRPPPPGRARSPHRVLIEDGSGDVSLVFFGWPRPRVEAILPQGARRLVSGTIELWDGQRQMVHPARIVDERQAAEGPAVEAVYGLTEGVSSRLVAKYAAAALARLPVLPEWQDPTVIARHGFSPFADALRALHSPGSTEPDADGHDPARRRLAYDELLATQLALALVRARTRRRTGRAHEGDGRLVGRILDGLPFRPTGAQTRVLDEIRRDLASGDRMLRLLQGDVGSGKTLVALLAMASVVETGRQAALVAPTEILARQHAERVAALAAPADLTVALMTGRDRPAERRATLAALADGTVDILIGTHALMGDEVAFADLALAVVDEQHRFGVHQRLALGRKGQAVDMLVMTATPIPRSLALGYFGDMDMSVLDEKPPGRQPIETRTISSDRLDEVVAGVGRAIAAGDLVYWVCPLVAESESSDLAAAEERADTLVAAFGAEQVGLVHGRMKGPERDAVMERFGQGDIKVLVSTTVIEVGVDIPRATKMVIEHAERFGLAQLHQLRGRVGRGERASTCLLVFRRPLGQAATARLDTMRRTENGFEIAEEDLRLRGEGEILGTRQSGLPGFRLARIETDADLMQIARDDARLVVERDPDLASERGRSLRVLLYLFERDAAIRTLRAG